ncbi:hypothetical protein F2Q69_00019101 [Brassica cretica]|nr:hypothetical protein F2Q69_00019101 [Brassica cretica]
MPKIHHRFSHQVFNKFKLCFEELSKAKYLLFPSAYELEPKAVDFFTSKFHFPVYTTRESSFGLGSLDGGDSGRNSREWSHVSLGGARILDTLWVLLDVGRDIFWSAMMTFSLFWDQLLNDKMIVEEWRVGMRVKSKKKTELVRREEIKELVKRFMDGESEEEKEMRRRVCDLSRGSVAKTGSSDVNIDSFLRDITKIV